MARLLSEYTCRCGRFTNSYRCSTFLAKAYDSVLLPTLHKLLVAAVPVNLAIGSQCCPIRLAATSSCLCTVAGCSRRRMGSLAYSTTQPGRTLFVFDFDHTVVDGNTDTWITKALPGGDVPLEIKNSYEKGHWTKYMQRVLAHLHAAGVTVADMQWQLQQLPYTAGMDQLLQHLQHNPHCSSIILSDSNSQFIDWILTSRGHDNIFSNVYTNPAVLSDCDQLLMSPYHSHSCSMCPQNMCKRVILQQHLQESQQQYGRVIYIGDGANDLCPAQALRSTDIVFVRAGYALDKLLQEPAVASSVAADVVQWETADDIMQNLQQL